VLSRRSSYGNGVAAQESPYFGSARPPESFVTLLQQSFELDIDSCPLPRLTPAKCAKRECCGRRRGFARAVQIRPHRLLILSQPQSLTWPGADKITPHVLQVNPPDNWVRSMAQ